MFNMAGPTAIADTLRAGEYTESAGGSEERRDRRLGAVAVAKAAKVARSSAIVEGQRVKRRQTAVSASSLRRHIDA
eukprot:SAG11_NODE_15044_length_590_cov_42.924644_1_plen_75_part_01